MTLNEFHANKHQLNEQAPTVRCTQSKPVNQSKSSFIQAFFELAATQRFFNSSARAFVSRLAQRKTIISLRFVPSALAAKQGDTMTFLCPVVFKDVD